MLCHCNSLNNLAFGDSLNKITLSTTICLLFQRFLSKSVIADFSYENNGLAEELSLKKLYSGRQYWLEDYLTRK